MGSGEGVDGDLSWASDLEREYDQVGRGPEGEGWVTFRQMSAEMDCGIVKARKVVRKAVEEGRLETFTGSALSPSVGTLCRMVWYRPVKD